MQRTSAHLIVCIGALLTFSGDAVAQTSSGSPAPTPSIPNICATPEAQIGGTCNWATWAIGEQGVALIADLKSPATYVVCRNSGTLEDRDVDLMTVIDGKAIQATVGGGQVGFYGQACQLLRGSKIYLSVQQSGANKQIIKGFYKRIDEPVFSTGFRWSVPRKPTGTHSFLPILSMPQQTLTRVCFASNQSASTASTDFRRSRRILVGPASYLTYAQGAQAQFTPNSCVDLEHSQIILDIDWAVEGTADAKGVFYLRTIAAAG